MTEPETDQLIPADARARRVAILVFILAGLFCAFLLWLIQGLDGPLMAWLEANIELVLNHPEIVFFASLLLVSPLLFGAWYLFRYGSKVIASGQFPAPGYRLIRPMRLMEGKAAHWRGRLIQVSAGVILLCSIGIPFFLTLLFVMLG